MRIIPAIDIIDGSCVRLRQGDYDQVTRYRTDPLEVAKEFEEEGARYLHLVDLDGAREGRVCNRNVLQRICEGTGLKVDFGGGLRSKEDLQTAFESGAYQVNLGSIAARDPEQVVRWIEEFGPDRFIISADVRFGRIAVNGWRDQIDDRVEEFLLWYHKQGILYATCTDVERDGMLSGPSFELYEGILQQIPNLKIVASGGVTTLEDVVRLERIGLDGVILGKALYEGVISLTEIREGLERVKEGEK